MTYSAEVLADSPLIYWRLGDASGTTATDSSGNAKHGTYAGSPTLGVAGLINDADTAVQFDGTNDRVTVADTTDLTAFTAEAWIKKSSAPANDHFIMTRDDSAGRIFQMVINSSGQASGSVFNSSLAFRTIAGATNICDNARHHVVFTFSTATSNLFLYVDGAQVATNTRSGTLTTANVGFAVGHDGSAGSSGNYFSGVIDEAAYYTTALSSTRVGAHYTAGTAATGAAIKRWNGTTEAAATVSRWNGTTEAATTVKYWNGTLEVP